MRYRLCLGGVFIGRNEDRQVFYRLRGASVAPMVWERGGVGLVGADVTEEQDTLGLQGEAVASIDGLRFVLAGRPRAQQRYWEKLAMLNRPLIATSYPTITRQLLGGFADIKLTPGAAEAMPWLFREVDAICDLARTGETLRQNGLEIFQELAPVRLVLVQQAQSGVNRSGDQG